MDVETQAAAAQGDNPYQQETIHGRRPSTIVRQVGIIFGAIYILNEVKFFQKILYGSKVNHELFKIGLAISVAILAIKAYCEMYLGRIKKVKVNYENLRQETHLLMILIILASISFHIAIKDEFGGFWKTVLFLDVLFGYGLLLHTMLLIPTWAQNLISSVLMTWFIQQYK